MRNFCVSSYELFCQLEVGGSTVTLNIVEYYGYTMAGSFAKLYIAADYGIENEVAKMLFYVVVHLVGKP